MPRLFAVSQRYYVGRCSVQQSWLGGRWRGAS